MLQICDCCDLCLQGRSHLKGRTRGGCNLCRYRWVTSFCRQCWSGGCNYRSKGLQRCCHSLCVEPLCVLTWPVPRPAVLSRHPAADPDHSSASQRHLRSDVYAGRVELSAETLRERKCETQTVQQITAPLSRLLPEAQDLIRVETRDANMFGQPQHCALLQDQTVILFCVYPLLKLSSWSIENLFFTSFIKIENQHFLATAS